MPKYPTFTFGETVVNKMVLMSLSFGLALLIAPAADAGCRGKLLGGKLLGGNKSCCQTAPSCCAPAPVVCCEPAPVVCCAPAPVVCCEPAPVVCCEPAPVVCCEPAPVVCCEPAVVCCDAAPSCCGGKRAGLISKIVQKKKSAIRRLTSRCR